jgi:hypothetical protein
MQNIRGSAPREYKWQLCTFDECTWQPSEGLDLAWFSCSVHFEEWCRAIFGHIVVRNFARIREHNVKSLTKKDVAFWGRKQLHAFSSIIEI